ncbi:DUF2161 domain-containing phosphodiesterase [Pontivivens ytuae]|uniref:Uncharacterized protein n=1 Tax=Pontivivens ytuae TaxID=2789856 RepID=A0A7S9LUS5_9RHOB|nr:DUF2161 family putative PD-(D/E)XK-type phosphodiesterase [Pontivivens ytuae]QPH55712.1 hypothetical protein I0K15_08295 [Pontivivens ytuae]
MRESELYGPVKALLEGQGYEVKGEIGACDLVAVRGEEPPVIVELKTGLTLALLMQGVDRLAMSDAVYLAVPRLPGRGRRDTVRIKALLRRIGLGLIVVKGGVAEVHCDPGHYAPRGNPRRKDRLLREWQKRVGDPEEGGRPGGAVMTAYRQGCLRLAAYLVENGPSRAAVVGAAVEVEKAANKMRDNHYGWFERVSTGVYDVTEKGRAAVAPEVDEPHSVM